MREANQTKVDKISALKMQWTHPLSGKQVSSFHSQRFENDEVYSWDRSERKHEPFFFISCLHKQIHRCTIWVYFINLYFMLAVGTLSITMQVDWNYAYWWQCLTGSRHNLKRDLNKGLFLFLYFHEEKKHRHFEGMAKRTDKKGYGYRWIRYTYILCTPGVLKIETVIYRNHNAWPDEPIFFCLLVSQYRYRVYTYIQRKKIISVFFELLGFFGCVYVYIINYI